MSGLQCYKIKTPSSQKLADIAGLRRDFESVIFALDTLLKTDDPQLKKCLYIYSLIAFRRCFKSGIRTIISDEMLSNVEGAITYRNYILSMADKHAAHSVNPFEDALVGAFVDDNEVIGVATLAISREFDSVEGTIHFLKFVQMILREFVGPFEKEITDHVVIEAKNMDASSIIKGEIMELVAPPPEDASKARR